MTILHAGGKFDGKSYAVSGGLHGVGVTVVNALSTRLDVARLARRHRVAPELRPSQAGHAGEGRPHEEARHRDHLLGRRRHLRDDDLLVRHDQPPAAGDGLPQQGPDHRPARRAPGSQQGRDRSGRRDPARGGGAPAPGHEDEAFEATEITYRYDGGLDDYVTHINAKKSPIHKSVVSFSADGIGKNDMRMSLDVAMQWSEAYSESVYTFANIINTHEGGTHEEGFRAALTSIVNRYAEEKKILKAKDEKLTGEDIREGLAAIVSVKLGDPQFEGQTKTKLGNTEVKGFVQKVCNEQIGALVRGQPGRGQDRSSPRPRRPPAPGARRRTPASWPARTCSATTRCRASSPTAARPTRATPRSTSSRATRPAARPSPAATRCSRRSCRSAARSSTSRRRASTGSSRTTRSSR